jgi:small conductance mechanosensitive channel
VDINAMLAGVSIGAITFGGVLKGIALILIGMIIIRIIMKIVGRILSKTRMEARIQKYALTGIKAILYVVAALMVIDSLGIPTTSLVALLSVFSLGITLAAEDILANLAGGMVILASHPFNIGDIIEVSGVAGSVEEINLNYTKLLTADGQTVMMPNKTLADSQVTNYSKLGRRRVVQVVTASYGAPTETVKKACEQALAMTSGVLQDPAPAVYLSNYKESSIEYKIFCWSPVEAYWDVYFGLGENLRTTFADNGVEMTYDHLNVHIIEKV